MYRLSNSLQPRQLRFATYLEPENVTMGSLSKGMEPELVELVYAEIKPTFGPDSAVVADETVVVLELDWRPTAAREGGEDFGAIRENSRQYFRMESCMTLEMMGTYYHIVRHRTNP